MIQPNQAAALQLGAVIECDVTFPSPGRLTARLSTPEALEHGRELLADPSSGWRLSAVTVTPAHTAPPAVAPAGAGRK